MTVRIARLVKSIKRQSVGLACSITVGMVLIAVGHAPAVPVILGCVLAFAYLVYRAPGDGQKI